LVIFFDRPARNLAAQVSIDDRRRCELGTILCDKECREAVKNNNSFKFSNILFVSLSVNGWF
jgi:hypothetical protein